jgi:HisJ family histidinol phosphate phosphatase
MNPVATREVGEPGEVSEDPRLTAIPDNHGHAKGEHKPYAEERPIPYTARMLFLWFFHAARRGYPRFMMVADHMNYLTFEDPAAVNSVRRALKLAAAGDLYGAAETAGVEVGHAAIVSEGMRRGMRFSIGAEVDNDPRSRPDAQNIVDSMKPDGMIRSVHFLSINHPETGAEFAWPFDNPEFRHIYDALGTERVWEIYMATLLDAIEKLPGQIIGHFYVPANFGHWPAEADLERFEDQLIEACAVHGKAIELNSRPVYRGRDPLQAERYRSACVRLLKKAKEKGVGVSVGADAHSPKDQGAAFEWVLGVLDEADLNEIVFPIGGRLLRVALRATKELLEQQAAEQAAAAQAAMPPPEEVYTPVETVTEEYREAGAPAAEQTPKAARETRPAAKRTGSKASAAKPPSKNGAAANGAVSEEAAKPARRAAAVAEAPASREKTITKNSGSAPAGVRVPPGDKKVPAKASSAKPAPRAAAKATAPKRAAAKAAATPKATSKASRPAPKAAKPAKPAAKSAKPAAKGAKPAAKPAGKKKAAAPKRPAGTKKAPARSTATRAKNTVAKKKSSTKSRR